MDMPGKRVTTAVRCVAATTRECTFDCPEIPALDGQKIAMEGRTPPELPWEHSPSDWDLLHDDTGEHAAKRAAFMADNDVRACKAVYYQGRESRATKTLSSYGTARKDQATWKSLRAMHGSRVEPLRLPAVKGPQVRITTQKCYEAMHKEAGSKNAPVGSYGWSMDLLVHDRGTSNKEDTLMWELTRCAHASELGRFQMPLHARVGLPHSPKQSQRKGAAAPSSDRRRA